MSSPAVFVYGTLMPGHLRWGLISPYAGDHRPATVAGRLYDTGLGWPAARFAAPVDGGAIRPGGEAGTIPGWYVELHPSGADRLLAALDEVEDAVVVAAAGPPGVDARPLADDVDVDPARYGRRLVRTGDGATAWAYEAGDLDPAWPAIDAWTDQPER